MCDLCEGTNDYAHEKMPDQCPGCGIVYSFVFGGYFHKKDCPYIGKL